MSWARFLPFSIAIGSYTCGQVAAHYWYAGFAMVVVGWFVGDCMKLIAKAESRNV